jgi:hypothetical protein
MLVSLFGKNYTGSMRHDGHASGTALLKGRLPIMEKTAAQYREFADECERLAKTGKIERDQRSILKEMADTWRNLAEKADKGA